MLPCVLLKVEQICDAWEAAAWEAARQKDCWQAKFQDFQGTCRYLRVLNLRYIFVTDSPWPSIAVPGLHIRVRSRQDTALLLPSWP